MKAIRMKLPVALFSIMTLSSMMTGIHGHSHGEESHGHSHDHGHSHSHDHGHSEDSPISSYADYENLFPAHLNKEDINVKLVLYLCKLTKAHLFLEAFDQLMKPLPKMVQALSSTLFISVVPIFLIFGMNKIFMRSKEQRDKMTQYLISFAIGGLLGDVFFHTLPHMNAGGHGHSHGGGNTVNNEEKHGNNESHGHSSEETMNNLIIILGIISFFLIEKLTTSLLSDKDQSHGHSHSKDLSPKKVASNHLDQLAQEKEIRYKSYAIISMVGDFIHNFTDGLSIGVAYVANYKMGVITTMAMLFHEIPHEVGDFALLFSLNYSIWSILGLQIMTATGAMAGTVIGSYIGNLYMNQCLAFTSGGFLYFAINGLMGELKEVKGLFPLIKCIFCIFLGLYFMFVFALFE